MCPRKGRKKKDMKIEKGNNTEEKILASAKRIFFQKGLKGARMQEIADDAEVNKAMLHYYFRSKERLFEKVFQDSIAHVTPRVTEVFLEESVSFRAKIGRLVGLLVDLFAEEPFLSNFFANELARNPDKIFDLVLDIEGGAIGQIIPILNQQILEAIEAGKVKSTIRPAELMLNIFSLCLLPMLSKGLVQRTLGIDDDHMDRFMQKRKRTVTQFVLDAIRP